MLLALGTKVALLVSALTGFVTGRLHHDQRGQTTMEWLGIALVIAVVLVALASQSTQITTAVRGGIVSVLDSIFDRF